MPNVIDLHIILRKPYTDLLDEAEQLLWHRNGKPGKAIQYKAETIRYAINIAHKQLRKELGKKDAQPLDQAA